MEIVFDLNSGMVGNHRFQQPDLLRQALTHKSFHQTAGGQRATNYERLEFLGDSVLGLIVSDLIWKHFPEKPEGELSRLRAQLVNEEILSGLSKKIGLNAVVVLGHGEREAGGANKDSILADVFEAVVGALYIDGGLAVAREFVLRHFAPLLSQGHNVQFFSDFKTELQELTQSISEGLPCYRLTLESGPPHNRQFEVEVLVANRVIGAGVGSSKKRAEQAAAQQAFQTLVSEFSRGRPSVSVDERGLGEL